MIPSICGYTFDQFVGESPDTDWSYFCTSITSLLKHDQIQGLLPRKGVSRRFLCVHKLSFYIAY